MYTFSVGSVVRGYHEYKDIWDAAIDGLELPCEREPGNPRDTSAVAVVKRSPGASIIVGHVPRLISMVCSIFIRRGGFIVCVVTGPRQYSADLPQGGLEVPCYYSFKTIRDAEGGKARKMIEVVLSVEIIPTIESDTENKIGGILIQASDEISPDDQRAVTEADREMPESHEPPHKKRKLSATEIEKVIMGEELSDIHINLAQRLLRAQFPELNGLLSTLLQGKETSVIEKKEKKMLQIIHSTSRHHWIVATTIGSKGEGDVLVYDSIFKTVDGETKKVVYGLFKSLSVANVKVVKSQKQRGVKDCGLFAVAFATALAYGQNPSKLKFQQDLMRSHLITCFQEEKVVPFP